MEEHYDSLVCRATPLGDPLPDDEHACSVSMPLWDNIIKYETGCPIVHGSLSCGYPRFVFHPFVKQLNQWCLLNLCEADQNLIAVVFPTEKVARRCVEFVSKIHKDSNLRQQSLNIGQATMLAAPIACESAIKLYWQHTGEILSSRYAKYLLQRLEFPTKEEVPDVCDTLQHRALCDRIAQLTGSQSQDIYLYPSGMAAIFASLRILLELRPRKKSVMFGFPYLDSLKLLRRPEFGGGVYFYPKATPEDFISLQKVLEQEDIVAIFAEFPGNPLPRSTDCKRLSDLAHKNGTVLVVDDTIGSYNIDAMKHRAADIVVTSLTKIFTGSGNVMGGSVALNPQSPLYSTLSARLSNSKDGFLFYQDVDVIIQASMDLPRRLQRVNATAFALVNKLRAQDQVKAVYYPDQIDKDRYESFLRDPTNPLPQYGPVFSILLHGGEKEAEAFYNALNFSKGPSLGTNFTLCCPYTMLAHYDELDFVESCGIDRNLIRVSVGLESFDQIWQCFQVALLNLMNS